MTHFVFQPIDFHIEPLLEYSSDIYDAGFDRIAYVR